MKKPIIGILSMQRVINYGSFLQAYALKQLIHKLGIDNIEFIDIEKGTPIKGITPAGYKHSKDKVYNIFRTIASGKLISKYRSREFFKKVTKNIINNWPLLGIRDVSFPYKDDKEFDYVIIGSDEVFNCCQESPWGFTAQLYGEVKYAKHVSTYAASFGQTSISSLRKFNLIKPISAALNNVEYISVRDYNSEEIVREITDRPIFRHLDPVLIYGYIEELKKMTESPISERYIIVYSYPERISNSEEIRKIKRYAKHTNTKIISIFCTYKWCDMYVIPDNILDVLRWFKFADCIFTDTFHGTIFSIITHSNFYSLVRPTNQQKMYSLLNVLELKSRILEIDSEIETENAINYSRIESILNNERKRTNSYLKIILGLE